MKNWKSIIPYILPYFTFILIGSFTRYFAGHGYFIYVAKTLITAALVIYWFRSYSEIEFDFSFFAVAAGILAFILWIGLSEYMPFKIFHPPPDGHSFPDNAKSISFLLVFFRIGGAFLLVPVFEELFMRSFIIRWLINPEDFKSVPMGKFTWFSFAGSIVLFVLGHRFWEWPAAAATGILFTLLLYRRKRIFDCIIAHAVTNLCLAIYVLVSGKFGYW
ncbi:MAG: CAAX prenyl protease-related protein [bacterium]|nr:CAAX prenyl protease-related protein [bacterium]